MLIDAFFQDGKLALMTAGVATLALAAKSTLDFSRSGPNIRAEVLAHYRLYTLFAFVRLCGYAFLVLSLLAAVGVLIKIQLCMLLDIECGPLAALAAATIGVLAVSALAFCWNLLYLPANIVASSHYRLSRLYPLWRQLTPSRLNIAAWGLLLFAAGLTSLSAFLALERRAWPDLILLAGFALVIAAWLRWGRIGAYPRPAQHRQNQSQLNILMIGSDTLRADRIRPELTPNICKLASRGLNFTQCYVPCARTAPSLISLLTGTWPHRHGVRDNFVADSDTQLPVEALPQILATHGYATSAISDWCGADMGKFSFGFERIDLPQDQWNLKYLIRQGPKDIRLFLSLFAHNALGKRLLPEIYYLGGVPLTDQLGRATCHELNKLANDGRPFLLNTFFSTTHPPFGSEYPYYTMYSSAEYLGESKFAMARLTDPWEIIRRQAEPREAFDLDQILHLYDGCVRRFDDEVGRILGHLEGCGLADNTIVVIYSDHGMEFFEHGTWGQGNSAIGDHSARIPLVISDPRRSIHRTVEDVVRSIDLAPTLLALLDLEDHLQMEGKSLAGYLRDSSHSSQRSAYYETGIWLTTLPGMPANHLRYPNIMEILEVPDKATGTLAIQQEYVADITSAKDRMIRNDRWKLVYQPLEEGCILLLFDVETDPGCTNDLRSTHPDIAAELWSKLRTWLALDDESLARKFNKVDAVNSLPRVSVVIPAYNRPALLAEAVASVRAQTLTDWELVIVDDASVPALALDVEDDRIRFIRNPASQGGAASKSIGIKAARAEILAFLDDDDLYAPTYLERAVATLDRNPGLDVIFMGVTWFGSASEWGRANYESAMAKTLAEARWTPADEQGLVSFPELGLLDALLKSVPMAFQRPVVRRVAFQRIGMYRPGCALWDCDWAISAALNAKAALLQEGLYLQRADGQGYSSRGDRRLEHLVTNIEIKERFLKEIRNGTYPRELSVKFRSAAAKAWFDLAWHHYQGHHTREAISALWASQMRQLNLKHLRLLVRLALPRK